MTPDEVNERAWKQMRSMTDTEIRKHEAAEEYCLYVDYDWPDIWDLRIAVRDYFFNELWKEVRPLLKDEVL